VTRHNGPDDADVADMCKTLGVASLDALVDETVPSSIRMNRALQLPRAISEAELLEELHVISKNNRVTKSFIGMGYSDCITPSVILRNVLENPGWYTAYTPYQAEISQGRLEALLNFQTMVIELTGMEIANASLLDEGTAAAEAMAMVHRLHTGASGDENTGTRDTFFVDAGCHPQTIDVVRGRAEPIGVDVVVGDPASVDWQKAPYAGAAGALLQIPSTEGRLWDARSFIEAAHKAGAKVVVATDLLACTMAAPPGEIGADVVVGSAQRFGVPMGYGGPHAAFMATKNAFARQMPGRLIGVTEDAQGRRALRMALQTREQHIRREKATSNVCTAQVLLAVMASMYGVYHGPKGLRGIAGHVHDCAVDLATKIASRGWSTSHAHFFDTIVVDAGERAQSIWDAARSQGMTLRRVDKTKLGIALDETTSAADVDALASCFPSTKAAASDNFAWPKELTRSSAYMTHEVFNAHHSETEMMRYIKHLEQKDFSLVHGMIPLGSCTMKLNAATEMLPVTWRHFGKLHPYCPADDAKGYGQIAAELVSMLSEITGFPSISLQPNAGSQGELAGMLAIRAYHKSRGDSHRTVCLIPQSAHGTNPASAVMAGLHVVVVKTDARGNIDVADLKARASEHAKDLAALMITYPSTHGVFESGVREICEVVHANGGQVYMDGANMNAQVGLTRPADIGADVCHLNLHKTFCIPHGGGGPGMGPIGVAAHLAAHLPRSAPVTGAPSSTDGIPMISAAPFGSASILLISYAYIRMMGGDGLTLATKLAILNANYIAKRLERHFPVVYAGERNRVAHECILELRPLKQSAGIEAEDVAKRLMDYGFHAPTLSFPVAGTLMVEPTESEPKEELDRFCDAMIAIKSEIDDIEAGKQPEDNNALKNAPHTMHVVTATEWNRPYARETAAFPVPWTRGHKFWPSVGRVNNALGDRKLVCSCPPVEDYM
jgi:glycine dehydrogenase